MKNLNVPGFTAEISLLVDRDTRFSMRPSRTGEASDLSVAHVVPAMQKVCVNDGKFCCYWGNDDSFWGCSKPYGK